MKHFALAAVAFVLFAGVAPARSQSSAVPADAAPQSKPQAPPSANSFQAQMVRGNALMEAKDYDQAAQIFAQLTRDNPKNPEAWNMLGIALQQSGKMIPARQAYTRATKLNPKFAEAYNNLGTTWYQEDRYAKAVRAYQKAISADPNLASAYSNMGCAYFNDKKYDKALSAFSTAIALDPDVFDTTGHSGTILQDRSVSDHGAFNFLLAKSYAERNDPATCAEYLRKAFDEGYKSFASVRTDPSFAKVLADPGVQAILARADASSTTASPPPAAPPS
jgi:tetratricopeptide (TPR) repeat protein